MKLATVKREVQGAVERLQRVERAQAELARRMDVLEASQKVALVALTAKLEEMQSYLDSIRQLVRELHDWAYAE